MLLYDNKDKHLDIYEFNSDRKKMIDYKLKELKKIPENERFLVAKTRINSNDKPLFEEYISNLNNDIVLDSTYVDSKDNNNGTYHKLEYDNNNSTFLENYYIYSNLKDKSVVQIKYLEMIKYYLLYSRKYRYLGEYEDKKDYQMDNILQIPESLYLLQLIEQEKFKSLDDKDIEEQLSLYTLSKKDEIPKELLKKASLTSLVKDKYEIALNKALNDSHILKKIKK